jgi:hypothetical protein
MSAATAWRALTSREAWKQAASTERSFPAALWRAVRGSAYLVAAKARDLAVRTGLPIGRRTPLHRDLARIAAHGTTALFVFTPNESGLRTLRAFGGSAVRAMEAEGTVTVVELQDGDHVFSPPGARRRLIEEITARLVAVHPVPTPAAADLTSVGAAS